MKKYSTLISIIFTSFLLFISVIAGAFFMLNGEEEGSSVSNVKYQILIGDKVDVYMGTETMMTPYLIDNTGAVMDDAKFYYKELTEGIHISYAGGVSIQKMPQGDAYIEVNEKETKTSKTVKLNIIDLQAVNGWSLNGAPIDSKKVDFVYGETYTLSIDTNPAGMFIKDFSIMVIEDESKQGVKAEEVFEVEYQRNHITLKAIGIGAGEFQLSIQNSVNKVLWGQKIKFNVKFNDDSLTQAVLAESKSSLMTKSGLGKLQKIKVNSAVKDLSEVSALPALTTIVINSNQAISCLGVSSDYFYKVPEGAFKGFCALECWKKVINKIIPFIYGSENDTYVVYHMTEDIEDIYWEKVGSSYKLSVPQKTGYKYNYWQDEFGAKFTDSKNIPSSGMHLYANWSQIRYHIEYNYKGEKSTEQLSYAEEKALKSDKDFQKTPEVGSKFAGWATDESKTQPDYLVGLKYSKLADKEGAVVKLYAIFVPIEYTVEFVFPEDVAAMEPVSLLYNQTYELPKVTRVGYTLKNWEYVDGKGIKQVCSPEAKLSKATTQDGGVVSLKAIWEEKIYKVHIDYMGGKDTSGKTEINEELKYETTYTLPTVQKNGTKGYEWYLDVNNNSTFDEGEQTFMPSAQVSKLSDGLEITLRVNWYYYVYHIQYELDGGRFSVLDINQGKILEKDILFDQVFELPRAYKTGYTCIGWKIERGDQYQVGDEVSGLSNQDGATVVLTAVWQENTYSVQYDTVGGSTINVAQYKYSQEWEWPIPTKIGCEFSHWEVRIYDFEGVLVDEEPYICLARESGKGLTSGEGDIVVAKAIWKYKVSVTAVGLNTFSFDIRNQTTGEVIAINFTFVCVGDKLKIEYDKLPEELEGKTVVIYCNGKKYSVDEEFEMPEGHLTIEIKAE